MFDSLHNLHSLPRSEEVWGNWREEVSCTIGWQEAKLTLSRRTHSFYAVPKANWAQHWAGSCGRTTRPVHACFKIHSTPLLWQANRTNHRKTALTVHVKTEAFSLVAFFFFFLLIMCNSRLFQRECVSLGRAAVILDRLDRFRKLCWGEDASMRRRWLSVLILENFTHSEKILISNLDLKLFLDATLQASSCSMAQEPTKPGLAVCPCTHWHFSLLSGAFSLPAVSLLPDTYFGRTLPSGPAQRSEMSWSFSRPLSAANHSFSAVLRRRSHCT